MFHKEPVFQPLAYGLVVKAERGICVGNGRCCIEILVPPIKKCGFFRILFEISESIQIVGGYLQCEN